MPKIVIVGGKLQGSEAAYLGKEAGIDVILIDQDPQAPAQNLCTQFICGDVLSGAPEITEALQGADLILPTMENSAVLKGLVKLADREGYVLAFDWQAYQISSSKRRSDNLFSDHGMSCPAYYPDGEPPYIAKPDSDSGSHGVTYLEDRKQTEAFLKKGAGGYIIQEFAEGPSYSIEVIGRPGNYRTYEITQIFVDDAYDCNCAAALRTLEPEKKKKMQELAIEIAEAIGLKGIMDLEVIDHHGQIKILEIDARLPSQTSIVVYHASGMNYIKELYDLFCKGDFIDKQIDIGKCASLTHFLFDREGYGSYGEHIMVEGGALDYTDEICSEAVVISDFCPARPVWRGTFINWAENRYVLQHKEEIMEKELESRFTERKAQSYGKVFNCTETKTG